MVFIERRRFKRLDMGIIVKWKKTSQPSFDNIGASQNMAEGGIRFVMHEKPEFADTFDLELFLPIRKLTDLKAKVIWAEELARTDREQKKRYDVGLEFIQIKEADKKEIIKLISPFVHKKIFQTEAISSQKTRS